VRKLPDFRRAGRAFALLTRHRHLRRLLTFQSTTQHPQDPSHDRVRSAGRACDVLPSKTRSSRSPGQAIQWLPASVCANRSQSRASRRYRPSQPNVRSTTHLRGSSTKPFLAAMCLTTFRSISCSAVENTLKHTHGACSPAHMASRGTCVSIKEIFPQARSARKCVHNTGRTRWRFELLNVSFMTTRGIIPSLLHCGHRFAQRLSRLCHAKHQAEY